MKNSSAAARSQAGHDLFKTKKKKGAGDTARAARAPIQLGEHSRYQIKSGWLGGTFVARAFPKPPTDARGVIAEATGATEEAAIAALHEVIDARETRRTDERRVDETAGLAVPSVEEYTEAVRQVSLSKPQRAMLTALSLAGEDGLTEARMTRAAGYKSLVSATRSFLSIGLLIADYLSVDRNEATAAAGGPSLLGVKGGAQDDTTPDTWVLHAELREAVRRVF